ncbi:MAG: hypothetical protein AABZ31_12920 [Bdellovibrionota bacterium]
MAPRLNSSKKWTSLPPELLDQVRSVFEEAFEIQKNNGKFITEGRIYTSELLFRAGYTEKGRLKQANFEVSIDFAPEKQNALELIHLAIDCTASMMETYFAEEESFIDMPTEWKVIEIDNRRVYVQVSTTNSTLEKEADKLLGESAEDLVVGDDTEVIETTVKKMLGIDDVVPGEDDEESEDGDDTPDDGRNRKDH